MVSWDENIIEKKKKKKKKLIIIIINKTKTASAPALVELTPENALDTAVPYGSINN